MVAEGLEGFTETRVEPGEATDGDLEKEEHPGLEEMREQTFRGTRGNAGPGNGVGSGQVQVRRRVVGEGARRGRELGRRMGESGTMRSKDAARLTVTVPVPSRGGNSVRNG